MTPSEITAEVASVVEVLQAQQGQLSAYLEAGSATREQLESLRVALQAIRDRVAVVRGSLDSTAPEDWEVYEDPEVRVAVLTWERGLRKALVALIGQAGRLDTALDELLSGSQRRTHVVRSGDSLQSLAGRYLGSWEEWRRIAELNGLAPGALEAGQVLFLPDKR